MSMGLVIKCLLALLLLVVLLQWLGACWRRRYAFEPGYQRIHFTRTGDGWRIALFHYPAARRLYALPVILCHGLGANRYNFDLGPDRSLARYLQARGFEGEFRHLRTRSLARVEVVGLALVLALFALYEVIAILWLPRL